MTRRMKQNIFNVMETMIVLFCFVFLRQGLNKLPQAGLEFSVTQIGHAFACISGLAKIPLSCCVPAALGLGPQPHDFKGGLLI